MNIKSLSETRKKFIAGMLAFNLVIIVQTSGLEELDIPLKITVYAFTISLPLQVLLLIINDFETSESDDFISGLTLPSQFLLFSSSLSFSTGLISLFFHFSVLIGFIFLISSIIAFLILIYFRKWEDKEVEKRIEMRKNREKNDNSKK